MFMGRITVNVNEEWLTAAQQELGTKTKVATINEALKTFAQRRKARAAIAILDNVTMDPTGSADAIRYGGGRDLSRLIENAQFGDDERASLWRGRFTWRTLPCGYCATLTTE